LTRISNGRGRPFENGHLHVLHMRMKKRIRNLRIGAVGVLLCGLAFALGGPVMYRQERDIQMMFESGNWSLRVVLTKLGVRNKEDLRKATPREDILLTALANTNKQCSSLAAVGAEVSLIFTACGFAMMIAALSLFREVRKLNEEIAEQNARGYSPGAADGLQRNPQR